MVEYEVNFTFSQSGLDGYRQELNQINRSTGTLNNTHTKLSKTLRNTAGQFFMLYGLYMVGSRAIQEMTDLLGESVDSFRDFNEAITEVSTLLMDLDNNLLPSLRIGVESLSVTFGKSANDLANGLYQIISAAVPAEDALGLLYTATKASIAGLSDVSTSVDVLTSILNAYNMEAEQMVHVSDIMFEAIRRGKFRYEDLASALGYLVPIAAQAGISFEEIAAALETATRAGQHVDMVSRGLALAIQNIIKPGQQAIEVAHEYGIELDLATLRAKGLIGFIEELNEKTKGNAAIISQIIPNMRSYRVMMVLAGDGVEGLKTDIELMSEVLGRADTAFSKMAQTGQRSTDIITQAFEDVKRAVGEATLPLDLAMKKFDIFKGFLVQEVITPSRTTGNAIKDVGHEFLGLIGPIGGVINAITKAGGSTATVLEEVDSLIDQYSSEWESKLKAMFPDVEEAPQPLFQRLVEGEKIALDEYEDVANRYLQLQAEYVEAATEFEMGKLTGAISDPGEILRTEFALQSQYKQIMDLYDAYAYWKSAILDSEQAIKSHSTSVDIFSAKLESLKTEVGNVGNVYDGTIGKQLRLAEADEILADMTEYLNLAVVDEKYQIEAAAQGFEWYTSEVAEAVSVVRAYEAQQKAATAAQKEFNFALAENQLQTMRLQLIGMMRRRGLTRTEQRAMKQLQIERTKIQIEQAKKRLDAEKAALDEETSAKEMAYGKAKEIIDALVRDQQHGIWLLERQYNNDVENLRNAIETKEAAYRDLTVSVIEEHDLMGQALTVYKDLVSSYYEDDIPASVQASIDKFNELFEAQRKVAEGASASVPSVPSASGAAKKTGNVVQQMVAANVRSRSPGLADVLRSRGLPGFAQGIARVPHDMLAVIHKNEAVVPAKFNRGNVGGSTIIQNSFGNIIIKDEMTLNKFMKMMKAASMTEYIADGDQKSNYRQR